MTVRDLIKELEDMPMDLPVINDLKEISDVKYIDGTYYLDNSLVKYNYSQAVIIQ